MFLKFSINLGSAVFAENNLMLLKFTSIFKFFKMGGRFKKTGDGTMFHIQFYVFPKNYAFLK